MYAPRLKNTIEDRDPDITMRRLNGPDLSDPFDVYRRENASSNSLQLPPSRSRYFANPLSSGQPLRGHNGTNTHCLPGYSDPERYSIHTETRSNQAFGSIKHPPPSEFADRASQFGLEGTDGQPYSSEIA